MDPGLEEATAKRLAAQRTGQPQELRLHIAALEPGAVGVLEAEVRSIGAPRPYARKRGGDGLLQRVTLADATGEVDVVLWDDELGLARDGPLQPGNHVRLHGPLVKAGYRGGVELGLQGAHVVAAPQSAVRELTGQLLAVGDTKPLGDPPALRFTCELEVATVAGTIRVAAWDDAVKAALAAGVGSRIRLWGRPNPFLEGWWTTDRLVRLERVPA